MACRFCFTLENTDGSKVVMFQSDNGEEYRVQYEVLESTDLLVDIDWTIRKRVLVTAELHMPDFSSRFASEGNIVHGKQACLILCNAFGDPINSVCNPICLISVVPHLEFKDPTLSEGKEDDFNSSIWNEQENVLDLFVGLAMDMHDFLIRSDMTDATLTNGKIELNAHKAILSARSSAFSKILFSSTEKKPCIMLPDVSNETLEVMMAFIYAGFIKIKNIQMAQELYKLAYEYEIDDLFDVCSKYLSNVTLDSALDVLLLADSCDDESLKRFAMIFIAKNISELKECDQWTSFSETNPDVVSDIMDFLESHSDV